MTTTTTLDTTLENIKASISYALEHDNGRVSCRVLVIEHDGVIDVHHLGRHACEADADAMIAKVAPSPKALIFSVFLRDHAVIIRAPNGIHLCAARKGHPANWASNEPHARNEVYRPRFDDADAFQYACARTQNRDV